MPNYVFLTRLERKLLEEGFASFTDQEKEEFTAFLGADVDVFEYHKELKTEIMSDLSDDAIANGFVSSNGHTYRTRQDDQINLLGKMIQLILVPTIEKVNWKTEDVGYVELTKDEWMQQVFVEGLMHKEAILYKFNTKKQMIQEAQTEAEILSVTWE